MSEKTEQPTPKRLAKARSEGDSPLSAALSQSVGFVAALAVVGGAMATVLRTAQGRRADLAQRRALSLEPAALEHGNARAHGSCLVRESSLSLCGTGCLAVSGGQHAAASFAQTGGGFSLQQAQPELLDRLNVFTGLKNLFSWQRIIGIGAASWRLRWLRFLRCVS